MKVRKNCEKYERTVDYFIATTFQIFTALQDQKKKKKRKRKIAPNTNTTFWMAKKSLLLIFFVCAITGGM